jgi:hypothetical protein
VVLEDLPFARHFEWKVVLEYERDCPVLTDRDRKAIDDGLSEYRSRGIDDEQSNCESRSELEELKEGLEELQKTFGLPLEKAIEHVESAIEGYEEPMYPDDAYHYRGPAVRSHSAEHANEAEIRNLFMTLTDSFPAE